MKIFIKNMVCNRCMRVVREELTKIGINVVEIEAGRAVLNFDLTNISHEKIKTTLEQNGFGLHEDKKIQIIDKIKKILTDLIFEDKLEYFEINLSDFLETQLFQDYSDLTSLFSSIENISIEKYFILQKIERAKELLVYEEFSSSDIANKLGYGSVAEFLDQLKEITGFSSEHFINIKKERINTSKSSLI